MRRGPYRSRSIRNAVRRATSRMPRKSCPTPNPRTASPFQSERSGKFRSSACAQARCVHGESRDTPTAAPRPPRTPGSCHAGAPSRSFRSTTSRRGRRAAARARPRHFGSVGSSWRGPTQTRASGIVVAGLRASGAGDAGTREAVVIRHDGQHVAVSGDGLRRARQQQASPHLAGRPVDRVEVVGLRGESVARDDRVVEQDEVGRVRDQCGASARAVGAWPGRSRCM